MEATHEPHERLVDQILGQRTVAGEEVRQADPVRCVSDVGLREAAPMGGLERLHGRAAIVFRSWPM